MTHRRRWRKGTYMRVISAERIRAFVGPEPPKKMSARRLARAIGKTPGTIDHLLAGRMKTCEPLTAERIAEALEVPLELLFEPVTPSDSKVSTKPQAGSESHENPKRRDQGGRREGRGIADGVCADDAAGAGGGGVDADFAAVGGRTRGRDPGASRS